MNGFRFDAFARQIAGTMPRRRAIGAIVAPLAAALASPPPALACKKVGKKCDKNGDCCDGAQCKGGKNGKCRCKSGLTECGGRCKNLDNDEQHCGSCNTACASDATCQDGVCACARNDNAFACGTSNEECGPACAANEACVDGACVSCAEACPDDECNLCVRLADGATLCGPTTTVNCPEPCTSSDDCDGAVFNVCAVGTIDKEDGTASPVGTNCLPPAVTGLCAAVRSCGAA